MKKILIILGFITSFILGGITVYFYKELNLNSNDVSAISSVIYTILTTCLVCIAYSANKEWQEQKKYEEKQYILTEIEKIISKYKESLQNYNAALKILPEKTYECFIVGFGDFSKYIFENDVFNKLKETEKRASRISLNLPELNIIIEKHIYELRLYYQISCFLNNDATPVDIKKGFEHLSKDRIILYTSKQAETAMELVDKILEFCNKQLTM